MSAELLRWPLPFRVELRGYSQRVRAAFAGIDQRRWNRRSGHVTVCQQAPFGTITLLARTEKAGRDRAGCRCRSHTGLTAPGGVFGRSKVGRVTPFSFDLPERQRVPPAPLAPSFRFRNVGCCRLRRCGKLPVALAFGMASGPATPLLRTWSQSLAQSQRNFDIVGNSLHYNDQTAVLAQEFHKSSQTG